MRQVRPTLHVLRQLPADTFTDPLQGEMLRRGQFDLLSLRDLEHPLLRDAADEFADGRLPDTHREGTKAANAKVYEVRMRTGAAWRGAVMFDPNGDPWLVYVNKHDQFHRQAKDNLKVQNSASYMPKALDYKIRAREEARIEDLSWEITVLVSLVIAIRQAVESPQCKAESQLSMPGLVSDRYALEIQFEHDRPSRWEEAQNASSMATLGLRLSPGGESAGLHRIVQVIVPYLQVQDPEARFYYDLKGQLCIEATVTQAKLIQLVASADGGRADLGPARSSAPTHLHYVGDRFLNEAFVFGKAVRAVCGEWFVPTRTQGAESALPVCGECERQKPVAQLVLNLIRASLD